MNRSKNSNSESEVAFIIKEIEKDASQSLPLEDDQSKTLPTVD